MKRISLKVKLWATMLLTLIGLLLLVSWAAIESRATLLAERKYAEQNVVDAAYGIVADYAKQVDAHRLTLQQGQDEAKARLAVMRFPNLGYIMITDTKIVLMHPTMPELVNSDLRNFKNSVGVLSLVEMVKAAHGGEGFTTGAARLPNGRLTSKIFFTKRFAPWDWYLSSGVYVSDIDDAFITALRNYILVAVGIAALISIVMAKIINSVMASLGGEPMDAARIASRIAAGDLTQNIVLRAGDDSSMLRAMDDMQGRLGSTVATIRRGAETISVAAGEIAAANLNLSARTEEQAAALSETAASMEEITATVRQNAGNAGEADKMAVKTSEIADAGGRVVQKVVDSMQRISASSARIVDIISVIDGIAFQTNILALNAAVEAARAGEQGRGFAVVASEVRSLAQRSSLAAKEVKDLIGSAVQDVESGRQYAEHAGNTMKSVIESVRQVTHLIGEISGASDEQTKGIEQVNVAIIQMDGATQQNAAMVEQSAAAAQALEEQAVTLRAVVDKFRISPAHVDPLA
ncbi:hypothetical protein ASG35_12435 [Burkholderia sp. Leaf177]|uniref:methyl-accepting chemotaxis protein n=1 Tax=Burkholderia sp. Leaf177 TaxID=1736287 RepID=UPI0006FC9593|nr:methyl-accepting chemotaxis protein [Burkholderia sp. Leaf177]KQR77069.1 hypothetical protein ASG35_12435 [Burkholderia sp. Leaf177]